MLSENVLKNFLPAGAVVFGFGFNSVFKGNARTKINDLAKKLKLEVKQRIIDQVSLHSSKEEGLDIVGYIPFEDDNPNTIIILGQCTCGKDWFGKQNETRRFDRFYTYYINPFTNALFSPRDFENHNNKFIRDKDLTNGQILFERRRLINLSDEDIINSLSQSKVIVEHCIDYVEDIV